MTEEPHLQQRTPEWLKWRRGKLTATDACVLMNGIHFGKTILDLYNEKTNDLEIPDSSNYAMRRGVELEPLALAKFEAETGYLMTPRVMVHPKFEWMSASLDGYEIEGKCAVELKCPGKEDHALALKGIVPEKYVPQLQHQMLVTGLEEIYYMSYVSDSDFTIFKVKKDHDYTAKLIQAELDFWQRVLDRNPPEPTNRDSAEIDSLEWEYASRQYQMWDSEEKKLQDRIDVIKSEKEFYKNRLIALADNRSVHGAGIKLSKSVRRGHIDYEAILERMAISPAVAETFRKPSTEYWRVSLQGDESET